MTFAGSRSIRKSWQLVLLVVAAGAIAGCQLPFGGACTTEFVFGIVVEVRDSVTGAPAADGARLIARDGAYADTSYLPPVSAPDRLILQAAGERAGRYDVTVEKPNYEEWRRTGVSVRKGECHVIPVRLEARLQPAG